MIGIFDLIRSSEGRGGEKPELRLGLRLKIGDQETVCPLTGLFDSYEAMENGVQTIKQDLGRIMEKARDFFKGDRPSEEKLDFNADMEPARIWTLLSEMEDVGMFVKTFNSLEEPRRKEIAEHVLTHCNVFTGKASVFSSRYDNESAFME